MIVFLEGILAEKEPTHIIVNVGGVGYQVSIPISSYDALPECGKPVHILTVQIFREDAQLLFGFMTAQEKQLFELLTTVNGIGPKLALAVLSGLSVRDFKVAIAQGDVKRLSGISGVGKKMAERMVLEMRDKLGKGDLMEAVTSGEAGPNDGKLRDLIMALISLGYKQADAQQRVRDIASAVTAEMTLEDTIRLALSKRA